ncbi:MAG: ferrochelatase [Bdellovibrio sp.]
MAKIGVLLLNIGSPRSFAVKDVKQYLKNFLMDKDIIDIPFFLRWFLVHGIIVPRRACYSAKNYQRIWMDEGSPLTVLTERFANQLQKDLGDNYSVKIGMRYSEPGIRKALQEFSQDGIQSLIVAPLYPQYAEATTGSSLKELEKIKNKESLQFNLHILPPFYKEEEFIESYIGVIKKNLHGQTADHYLFSFHGLPESQIRKVNGCLISDSCCLETDACVKNCYRTQCFATATKIAETLNIPKDSWTVSFQSRLGRGEWLKPSTEHTLEGLAKNGKKSVAVICPSFVTDCLETLEEISIEGQKTFIENGGKKFISIPCLNDDSDWTNSFSNLIKNLINT